MNEVQTMICTVERKRFSKLIYVPLVCRHIKNTIMMQKEIIFLFGNNWKFLGIMSIIIRGTIGNFLFEK
jgi:hypothetical protein